MKTITTVELALEVRRCPSCHRTFKTAPGSPVIYDSKFCEDRERLKPAETPVRQGDPAATVLKFQQPDPIPRKRFRRRMPRLTFG